MAAPQNVWLNKKLQLLQHNPAEILCLVFYFLSVCVGEDLSSGMSCTSARSSIICHPSAILKDLGLNSKR